MIRSILFSLLLSLLVSAHASGSIINAASVSEADVTTAIAAASNGDTVVIPAGTATWTSKLTITKAITLRGNGIGNTIIRDGGTSTQMILWALPSGFSRITGIEFQNGGRSPFAYGPSGVIRIEGKNNNGSSFRFDNNKWENVQGVIVPDSVIGVFDHNTVNLINAWLYIYGGLWDGDSYDRGDGSWHAGITFGDANWLFIETNTVSSSDGIIHAVEDAYGGARFVLRDNALYNMKVSVHGTESSARYRGGLAADIYDNVWTGSNANSILGEMRSGVTIFHDNSIDGYQNAAHLDLAIHRAKLPFSPWGGADGKNSWDVNDTTNHTGNGYGGGPSGLSATGTANGASSGLTVNVTHSGTWSTNQWAGYSVTRTTNLGGLSTLTYSEIQSSTSTSITYSDNDSYGTPALAFTNGDSMEIYRVIYALDQPGRTGGAVIASVASPTPPAGWNDQISTPCYSWNNTEVTGPNAYFSPTVKILQSGRDYYNETSMPGYTEYTYPHPLTGGSPTPSPSPTSTPPSPPRHLMVLPP